MKIEKDTVKKPLDSNDRLSRLSSLFDSTQRIYRAGSLARQSLIILTLMLGIVGNVFAADPTVTGETITYGYAMGTSSSVSANFESTIKTALSIGDSPDLSKCF